MGAVCVCIYVCVCVCTVLANLKKEHTVRHWLLCVYVCVCVCKVLANLKKEHTVRHWLLCVCVFVCVVVCICTYVCVSVQFWLTFRRSALVASSIGFYHHRTENRRFWEERFGSKGYRTTVTTATGEK